MERTCPARVAAVLERHPHAPLNELAVHLRLSPSTLRNYRTAYRAGRIQSPRWTCIRCRRSSNEVSRRGSGALCAGCCETVAALSMELCPQCRRIVPIAEMRRTAHGRRCHQCVPPRNRGYYAHDAQIVDIVAQRGAHGITVAELAVVIGRTPAITRAIAARLARQGAIGVDPVRFPTRYVPVALDKDSDCDV